MSKKITLGKVSITPKGRWSADTQYEKLDTVLYEGSLWIAKSASLGQPPSEDDEYWKIAVEVESGAGGGSSSGGGTSVTAFLPDEMYLASGGTLEIYNRQVCPDADKYHFNWTCELGRAYDRKISITAGVAQKGEFPLSLDITDSNGNIVWRKHVTLIVSELNVSGKRLICPIGSMYTDGKIWLSEISENLSDDMIGFIGDVSYENDIYHEGRSGWTTETYLTKAEEYNSATQEKQENPFWDGENFSWEYYIDTYNLFNDAVQLFFGEEDLLTLGAEALTNNLLQIVQTIRTEGVISPIFIVLPPCPGTQNGMAKMNASDYGKFNGRSKYEIDKMFIEGAERIYNTIKDSGYEDIFFIPLTQCFDSENNFPTTQVKVNPRSSKTETIQSSALAPTDEGYKQMADVMYGAYCAGLVV